METQSGTPGEDRAAVTGESAGGQQAASQPVPGGIPPSFGTSSTSPPADLPGPEVNQPQEAGPTMTSPAVVLTADPSWRPPSQPEPSEPAPAWYPDMSSGSPAAGPLAAGPFAAGRPAARRGIASFRPRRRGRLTNVLLFGCGPLVLVGVVVAAFVLVSPGKGSAASHAGFQPGPAATSAQPVTSVPPSTASPSSSPAKKAHHRRVATASPSAVKVQVSPKPRPKRKATPKPAHSSGGAVPRNLGAPNFDGYCSHIGHGTAEVTVDNAYGWHCSLNTALVLQVGNICAWTYHLSASLVVGVSANFYDADAWQCWRVQGFLGQLDVSTYCAAAGLGASKLVADNAYGWECTASPAPVDTTAACDTVYHVSDAISRFAVFTDPYSWQCWV